MAPSAHVRRWAAWAVRFAATPVRTAIFLASRRPAEPGLPPTPPTPRFALGVLLDDLVVAGMNTPGRIPTRVEIERAGAAVSAAHEAMSGISPEDYHRTPAPPDGAIVERRRGYELLRFSSGWTPHPGEAAGWTEGDANRIVHVRLLRHREPRPWLVCLHGFGMGYGPVDRWAFDARRLHHELGLNVALPVLPLHGPRSPTRLSGTGFMSYDLVSVNRNLSQSVWDVRRAMAWLRSQGDQPVGLYGVSLGAHVAGVVSGLDDAQLIIAALPTCDLTELFANHAPRGMRRHATEHGLMGERAADLHRLVSPLGVQPRVPEAARFVFAGLGDRMATPSQALRLWNHWSQPRITWHPGNHSMSPMGPALRRFVREEVGAWSV